MNLYYTSGLANSEQQQLENNPGQYQQCLAPGDMLTDIMGNLEIADGGGCLSSNISFVFNGVGCTPIDFVGVSTDDVQN